MDFDARTPAIPRWAAGSIVALLMAAYVAGYVDSAAIQDTARDVYYAWAIRHGQFYPLEGPVLGGALHLGPAWFYLMAVPLWLSEGWLPVALFAGLLASLKFPLALACGSRLLDRDFGVLWAICLAAPGWTSFETLIFFNPNAAAAAVLLPAAIALRARDHPPPPAEALAFGLAVALALHVHPTTAPVGLLAVMMLAGARRAGASPGAVFAWIAAGFAAPFVPYLVSQWDAGFPDWTGAKGYVEGQVRIAGVANVPDLLWAYFARGPQMVATHVLGAPADAGVALAVVLAAPTLATIARGGMLLGGATLMLAAWIAVLRPTTPVYFVYALAPCAAALVALGLWRIAEGGKWLVAAAFALFFVAAGIAVEMRMAAIVRHGEGVLTSQVLDVKEAQPRQVYADTWFPASGREALGRLGCAREGPVALHGHLAFVMDRSVGVDVLMRCGTLARTTLLGRAPEATHWVGVSRHFWSHLDAQGSCRVGSLEVVEAASIQGAAASLAIPDGRVYFPRPHATGKPVARRYEFVAPAGHAVLVTNVLHGYEPVTAIRARAGGKDVGPVARNDLSALFVAPAGSGEAVAWVLSFEATQPDAVDVVTFATRPPRPTPCP